MYLPLGTQESVRPDYIADRRFKDSHHDYSLVAIENQNRPDQEAVYRMEDEG